MRRRPSRPDALPRAHRTRCGVRIAAAVAAAGLLAGCAGHATVTPTPRPTAPAPSIAPAVAALDGFLAAAAGQDENVVQATLATAADRGDLAEILRVYAGFGSGVGGFFWEAAGLRVVGARRVDATHAAVSLSGPIVWCLGSGPSDPTATCSAVVGLAVAPNTYAALEVASGWKADVDINASTGLDHNPRASPTPSVPTPTPT